MTSVNRRCAALATVVVTLATALGSDTARAAQATRLIDLPYAAQALTAYGGWVLFSQSDPGATSWRLMAWRGGGAAIALPIASRSVPFDADAGPDARGRPAVVYSRCAREPRTIAGGTLDWAAASGCHVYELELARGAERLVGQIGRRGYSDSVPSIWRGAIAFQRLAEGARPPLATVWTWQRGRPLRRLGGGSVPCDPARVCRTQLNPGPVQTWVQSMDLGPQVLALDWVMTGPNVLSVGPAWEMRADPLAGGRPAIADTGGIGGACEGAEPTSPNAVGRRIVFVQTITDCNNPPTDPAAYRTTFESFDPIPRRWRRGTVAAGRIGALAQDRSTSYWMRFDPVIHGIEDITASCDPTLGHCTLMRSGGLGLRPIPRIPASPPLSPG